MHSTYDLIEQFNDEEGVNRSESTREWYGYILRPYLDWLKNDRTPLRTSKATHVKRYLSSLIQQGKAPATRSCAYIALKCFYRWLDETDRISENPFEVATIKRPRIPKKLKRIPTLAEVQMVLETMGAHTHPRALRDRALFLLLVDSGLRRMEAVALDVKHVDQKTGRVAVMTAKGGDQRFSYISQLTIDAIEQWYTHGHIAPAPDAPIFLKCHRDEPKQPIERIKERQVNNILRAWSKQAGLVDPIRPHGLRSLFATHFSNAGGGSRVLQGLLGHKDLQTTEGYIIASQTEARLQHARFSPVNKLSFDCKLIIN